MRGSLASAAVAGATLVGVWTAPAAAAGDPYSGRQWALTRIEAATAWETGRGASTLVAVLDTGVDLEHEDLRDRLVDGRDVVDDDDDPQDEHGHGTRLAGIAAAATGNDLGISGVAPDARILPVRVLDAGGMGTEADVAAGIVYAEQRAAELGAGLVVVLGFADGAGVRPSAAGGRTIDVAVRGAAARGAMIVIATDIVASYGGEDVLRVAPSDRTDARVIPPAGAAHVLAPGVEIITTDHDPERPSEHGLYTCSDARCRTGTAEGASYATAHAAGAGALLLSTGMDAPRAIDRIRRTADPVRGSPIGRINAARAIAAVATAPPEVTPVPATPAPSPTAVPTPTAEASPVPLAGAPERKPVRTPVPSPPVTKAGSDEPVLPGAPDRPVEPLWGRPVVYASAAWLVAAALLFGTAYLAARVRPPPPMPAPGRVVHRPALDGIRGAAVLWVVALHTMNAAVPTGRGLPFWLWPAGAGALGVDLFFVLSGFLLVQRWDAIRAGARSGVQAFGRFARRRAVRIFPAFLVAMAVIVPWHAPDVLRSPRDIALLATSQQFLEPTLPWRVDGPTWSLTPELHFYLVLPLVALALRRVGRVRAVFVLLVLSVAWRVFSQDADHWPANLVFGRVDQFAVGMAAGLAVANPSPGRTVRVLASRPAGWFLALAGAAAVLAYGRVYGVVPTGIDRTAELIAHPVAGLVLAAMLVRATAGPRVRVLEHPVLRFVGLISYSLYLWHAPLLGEAQRRGGTVGHLLGGVAVSVVVAWTSFVLVERPAMRLKGSLSPRRRPRPIARPAGALRR